MAASINGIGTRFYGAAAPMQDGSVVTTKWFAIVFIPIIPLSSFRVIRQTAGDKFLIFGHSASYSIFEKLPIQWGQVLKTYGFALGFLIWSIGLGAVGKELFPDWHPPIWAQWLILIGVVPLPFYLLIAFRKREFTRIRNLTDQTAPVPGE